ncbi:MAG: hypothetical protein K8F91_05430 [Candidatus Obscuribacterales bacterium]|nr:hypothetical protein [Candidatus Obscuribacterales bacterium]
MKNLKAARIEKLGVVLEPDGSALEAEGVLNPASTRTRDGSLVLYTRSVATGNVSRIGLVHVSNEAGSLQFERAGFALTPQADYELRSSSGGQGCEDPRVTFVAALDLYLMVYTAFGDDGPRIAIATSKDALSWQRLGVISFPKRYRFNRDDKDAGFFPEPVVSPSGVLSLALYHRPMVEVPVAQADNYYQRTLAASPRRRQCIRIAYIPMAAIEKDLTALLDVHESHLVLAPSKRWGTLKVGAGSQPVKTSLGWLSIYHGVDVFPSSDGNFVRRYSAGLLLHDLREPHKILYRSKEPLFVPDTKEELAGVVNNVVFPTALDPRPDIADGVFDIYYGMADFRIGLARLYV